MFLVIVRHDIISRAVEGGLVQYWMRQFRGGRFGQSPEAWKVNLLFNVLKLPYAQEIWINFFSDPTKHVQPD